MSQEYFTILAHTIAGVGQVHAQLRTLMYELARIELRRNQQPRTWNADGDEQYARIKQQIASLEKVIAQVESELIDDTMRLTVSPSSVVMSQMIEDGTKAKLLIDRNTSPLTIRDVRHGEIMPPLLYASPREAVFNLPLPPNSHPVDCPVSHAYYCRSLEQFSTCKEAFNCRELLKTS